MLCACCKQVERLTYSSYCKSCNNEKNKKWRGEHFKQFQKQYRKKELPFVYKIVNTMTGDRYIGSTCAPECIRWSDHKSLLKKKQHHCALLQDSWNNHFEDDFLFEKIMICSTLSQARKFERILIRLYGNLNTRVDKI